MTSTQITQATIGLTEMKEADLAEKFGKKLLRKFKQHAWYYKIPDTSYLGGKKPADAMAIIKGIGFLIEYKIEPNKLTKYQKEQLDRVERAGGISMLVTDQNLEQCLKNIKTLIDIKIREIVNANKLEKGGEKSGNSERTP